MNTMVILLVRHRKKQRRPTRRRLKVRLVADITSSQSREKMTQKTYNYEGDGRTLSVWIQWMIWTSDRRRMDIFRQKIPSDWSTIMRRTIDVRVKAYENNRSTIHDERNLLLALWNNMRPWSQTAMFTFYDTCVSYAWTNLGADKWQVPTITVSKILTINASRFRENMKKPRDITSAKQDTVDHMRRRTRM